MSDITTAARRITRTINAAKPFYRIWFNLDGEEVGSQPADNHLDAPEGGVVSLTGLRGRTPITQREVQDAMDAAIARRSERIRDNLHGSRLRDLARDIAAAERELRELMARRDQDIIDAVRDGYRVMDIVADTGLTRGRVYQITRDA